MRVYLFIAHTPTADVQELRDFSQQLERDAAPVLESASGVRWKFHLGEADRLETNNTRHATDFMRDALLRMVQSPADMVVVITDVGLVSSSQTLVPGLPAPESRVAVLSTRKLLIAPFGDPVRPLDSPAVRWNAAALLLHLLGHLAGLRHAQAGVMARFEFQEERRSLPDFNEGQVQELRSKVQNLPEREVKTSGFASTLGFYLKALRRHPMDVLRPAMRPPAFLLPFSLTRLTAGAVAPLFVFLFTDEFWWLGVHTQPLFIWASVVIAVLAGTLFLPLSQQLFFPQRERRVVTEHVAIVNMSILLNTLLMMIGLFVFLVVLVLMVEWLLFPENYFPEWFESYGFEVQRWDYVQLAVIVAVLGLLTGALGGSLHGRAIIEKYGFFHNEP